MEWVGGAGLVALGAFLGGLVTYWRLRPLIEKLQLESDAIRRSNDYLNNECRQLRRQFYGSGRTPPR